MLMSAGRVYRGPWVVRMLTPLKIVWNLLVFGHEVKQAKQSWVIVDVFTDNGVINKMSGLVCEALIFKPSVLLYFVVPPPLIQRILCTRSQLLLCRQIPFQPLQTTFLLT
jgi:hypothetical protein